MLVVRRMMKAGVLVANYPLSIKILELDQADKDRLQRVIQDFDLPPSNRMLSALAAAFKIGYSNAKPMEAKRASK